VTPLSSRFPGRGMPVQEEKRKTRDEKISRVKHRGMVGAEGGKGKRKKASAARVNAVNPFWRRSRAREKGGGKKGKSLGEPAPPRFKISPTKKKEKKKKGKSSRRRGGYFVEEEKEGGAVALPSRP